MRCAADATALDLMRALLADDSDTLEETLAHARRAPEKWRRWSIARQLWYLRKRAKLSQAELARRCGIRQSHVARLERGLDARLGTVRRLLAGLGYGLLLLPCPLDAEEARGLGGEDRRPATPRRVPSGAS